MKELDPKKTIVIINGVFLAIMLLAQLGLKAQVTPIVDSNHIMWSGQTGTTGIDKAEGITCEFLGNTYVVGHVNGSEMSETSQSINTFNGGGFDGYIRKVNIYGQELWTSFIGGSGNDYCTSVIPSSDNNIIVVGNTNSTDIFGGTANSNYQGGNQDAFCAKLSRDGEVIWSTYIGGTGDDYAQDLSVDSNGNIYLVGKTSSTEVIYNSLPQTQYGGGTYDGFVTRINAFGEIEKFSFLGGSGTDDVKDLTIDEQGNIYICGNTAGVDEISSHATMPYFGGVSDAFVTCLNDELQLTWAEYVGGAGSDLFNSIDLDTAGNIVLGGNTNSGPIAFLSNSGSLTPNNMEGMIVCFTPMGTVLWSSFVNGSGIEAISDVHVDLFGNIYVGGTTDSGNLLSVEAFQSQISGGIDAFIAQYSSEGDLKWQSFLGGTSNDWFSKMSSDRFGKVMIAGYTNSAAFGEEVNYGNTDAYFARISDCNNPDVVIHTIDDTTFCYGSEALFTACGASHYEWMNQDTLLLTMVDTTDIVFVKGYNTEGCWGMSNHVQLTTLEVPQVTIEPMGPIVFCGEGEVELVAVCDTEAELSWNDPAQTEGEMILADTARTYIVTAEGPNGCTNRDMITIEFIELPDAAIAVAQSSVCISGTPVNLLGLPSGGYFVGNGVVGNTFDPELAGGGLHEIQYIVMDKDGCEGSSAMETIEVLFFPTVLFVADDSVCIVEPPFQLVGEPLGGTFSGDGVIGDMFFPAMPGTGGQNITYTYVDNQGCVNVANQIIHVDDCEFIGVEDIEGQVFSVYPNPAENFFNIQSDENTAYTASLLNISGQVIATFNGYKQLQIPTAHLAAGCYYVKINGEETSSTIQLMVQH
jgi:hypothetical protein